MQRRGCPMAKRLHVAISPITSTIFAGNVLKDGCTWASNKTDVTGEAAAAVAQRAIAMGGTIMVTANGRPAYEITAREILATEPFQPTTEEGL